MRTLKPFTYRPETNLYTHTKPYTYTLRFNFPKCPNNVSYSTASDQVKLTSPWILARM